MNKGILSKFKRESRIQSTINGGSSYTSSIIGFVQKKVSDHTFVSAISQRLTRFKERVVSATSKVQRKGGQLGKTI